MFSLDVLFYFQVNDLGFKISSSCVSKESDEAESSLLPRKQPSSFSTGFLVIGCLLLLLCGIWLLGALLWLHRPSDHQPQRHPPPAHVPRPDSQGRNESASRRREACASVPQDWRFDCYPERRVVVTRELCEARNCCFVPAASDSSSSAARSVPWCFYPSDFPSYSLASLDDTPLGARGKLVREAKTYYPADVLVLDVEVRYETETRLRVRVSRGFASCFCDGSIRFCLHQDKTF